LHRRRRSYRHRCRAQAELIGAPPTRNAPAARSAGVVSRTPGKRAALSVRKIRFGNLW
jgi:hypothetical protein